MNTNYNNFLYGVYNQTIDWVSDTIKAMLIRSTSTYVPDPDHDTVAYILANGGVEISVASYARITLGSKATTLEDANNRAKITAASLAFGTLEVGQTVKAVVIFKHVTNDADSIPLSYFDGKTSVKSLTPVTPSESGTITGITQANPAVVTDVAHGLSNGDKVYITGVVGMTQVNNLVFTVANKTDDTFQLSGINSSGYGAYTSGGTWTKCKTVYCGYLKESLLIDTALDFGGGATCSLAQAATAGDTSILVRDLLAAIDANDVATEVATALALPAALGGGAFTLTVPSGGLYNAKALHDLI